jgi:hypothetical protein
MRSSLLMSLFVSVAFALTPSEVREIFPSPQVDFIIAVPKSYAVCSGKRYRLVSYGITPEGENLYRVSLRFENRKPDKTKKVGFVKIRMYYHPSVVKRDFTLWYRGGRFAIVFKDGKALTLWDFSPKCKLRREGDYLIPTFGELKREVNLNGCKLELTFTFTRCGF